ncbi:phosphoribosylanthranilate isomerase [Paenibacillus sp. Leaf72]|uniref:phosphoribosylanthranilate isomerase n=1 Tax=Paenibacillus sp. Leaf72 TaxID=1736234 RepID=UPI0007C850DD|nr:phosphoribosylanthranilate isomerase [Paenibacillus sp. Leaf72]
MQTQTTPRIKICGLKIAETIQQMDGLPFHDIGFVFAPSKRQVLPAQAAELIEAVHALKAADGQRPQTVGVFVNPELEELRETLAIAPLDVVQLHGSETPAFCQTVREQFAVKVWKVFSIRNETVVQSEEDTGTGADKGTGDHASANEAAARLAPYSGKVDAVLIDTAGGGTGKAFNWQVIDDYQAAAAQLNVPLYVAGGLNPDNVHELLAAHAPSGLDVSSGVETDGVKDIEKIRLFVRKVMQR